jgi:hypothetical protein
LNSLITTSGAAPVITGQRLRKGSVGSPRGAGWWPTPCEPWTDSGRCPTTMAHPIPAARQQVSPTLVRADSAIYDEDTQSWISTAEVAEIPFTAFATQKKAHCVPGRLVVRRIPDLRPKKKPRSAHAVRRVAFPRVLHHHRPRGGRYRRRRQDPPPAHAIIEQVHADLKNSALAHLPSGKFCANAAWLVCAVLAFNLTRAPATLTGDPTLAKAHTDTVRRTLITVPTRIASSARKLTLHLPTHWPWEKPWITVFENVYGRNPRLIA